MSNLSERAPLQGLVAECEKLGPAAVVALRTQEPFQRAFRVDAFQPPDVVQRRHGLGGLKDVAKIPLLIAQIQNPFGKQRAEFRRARLRHEPWLG